MRIGFGGGLEGCQARLLQPSWMEVVKQGDWDVPYSPRLVNDKGSVERLASRSDVGQLMNLSQDC